VHGVDAQQVQRRRHPDDVRDRIQRPDLVEVHVVGGGAVHPGLGLGEAGERVVGERRDRFRQACRVEHEAHGLPCPVLRVGRGVDVDFHRADAVALDLRAAQRDRLDPEPGDVLGDDVETGPRVDECGQQHVARGPCRAVDPRDPACGLGLHGRVQCTTRTVNG